MESGTVAIGQLGFRPERLDLDVTVLCGYLAIVLLATYVAIRRVKESR